MTLKLEEGITKIYIKGNLFSQCKKLLLQVVPEDKESYESLTSKDEAFTEITITKMQLSPEEEFYEHCSNLQAWVENGYDTHLLEMRLAFPLLKYQADAFEF